MKLIVDFKSAMQAQFGIDDIGETKYFIGIEILRDRVLRTLKMHQHKYIEQIVPRFEIPDFGRVNTPTDPESFKTLSKTQCPVTEEGKKVMLQFSGGDGTTEPELVGMCDAAYACHEDAALQGGFFFSMSGAAVSWKSYRIRKVILSSTESEYVVCSDTSRVAEGHRNFLCDLGLLRGSGYHHTDKLARSRSN